ncbi:hypothetical protein C3L33_22891, partial [Rhododendron williamsianum]
MSSSLGSYFPPGEHKCHCVLVVLNTRALGGYTTIEEMVKPKSEMPWGNRFTFLHISIPKLIGGATDDQANLNHSDL